MKDVAILLLSNSVAIILSALAFYMVAYDKPYYGWVIAASMASAVYMKKYK